MKFLNSLAIFWLALVLFYQSAPLIAQDKEVTHQVWDRLLQEYVDEEGYVDYQGFQSEVGALDTYLDQLAKNPPSGTGRSESLAYYINLYNAATVKLILDHYPVSSIKDIKKPWDRKWIQSGSELLSLGEIEHEILRKMGEPRIHFAINCASYSCPKLLNSAFRAERIDVQLDEVSRDFVNDPTRNEISNEEARLSAIFNWYRKDFTSVGSLEDYINTYSQTPITADTRIRFIKYDWSLNEK